MKAPLPQPSLPPNQAVGKIFWKNYSYNIAECLGRNRAERIKKTYDVRRLGGTPPTPASPADDPLLPCLSNPDRPECTSRRRSWRPCPRVPWDDT